MILLLASRVWDKDIVNKIKKKLNMEVRLIKDTNNLEYKVFKEDPDWIFVLHWNYLIPKNIWKKYKTIIFHMTDLPYGRGGSPLQNLIKNKIKQTKVSAIECTKVLDGGNIYLKENLNLNGSAEEIFIRCSEIIETMIYKIVKTEIKTYPQKGTIVNFQRRSKSDSDLRNCVSGDLESWHDNIRMMDAEGYPHAFLEIDGIRLEFRRVNKRKNGLIADVFISKIESDLK